MKIRAYPGDCGRRRSPVASDRLPSDRSLNGIVRPDHPNLGLSPSDRGIEQLSSQKPRILSWDKHCHFAR
jgi:hypothetical protein